MTIMREDVATRITMAMVITMAVVAAMNITAKNITAENVAAVAHTADADISVTVPEAGESLRAKQKKGNGSNSIRRSLKQNLKQSTRF